MKTIFVVVAILCMTFFVGNLLAQDDMEEPSPVTVKQGEIKLSGYVQPRFTWHEADDSSDTFDVERARVAVSGHIFPKWYFKVQGDLAADTKPLRDGYIRWEYEDFACVTAGQFKAPFSEEAIRSSAKLDFVDRALVVQEIAPERDIGVMVDGHLVDKKFYYGVGIFNGTGENTADDNDDKDIVARVKASPFLGTEGALEGLAVGLNFRFGTQTLTVVDPTTGATMTTDDDRTGYGGVIQYKWDALKVQGEYIVEDWDNMDLQSDGFYVYATYDVPVDNVVVQPGIRYGQYDPDNDAGNDETDVITLGVNLFFNKWVKLQLNYVLVDEEPEVDNDEILAQLQVKF